MIRKTVLFFVFAQLLSSVTCAQTFSIGAGAGIAEYLGDIKYAKGDPKQFGEAYGISVGYILNRRWEVQMSLSRGTLKGDDALAIDPVREQRNLHFKNTLMELGLSLKYNILVEPKLQVYNKGKTHFTPYILGGIAGLTNNPQAMFEQTWHELQPLGTEGQFLPSTKIKPYSKVQISLPVGLGLSYRHQNFIFSIETGYRFTFTDYLDDVSTVYPNQNELALQGGRIAAQLSRRSEQFSSPGDRRGNANAKDAYIFSMIRMGYIIGR